MKKTIIAIGVFCVGLMGYSQETPATETSGEEVVMYGGDHELKLNAAYLLGGIFDVSYEHILNEESAVGISVAIPLESNINLHYLIIPYYRLYFGNKRAAGFFIEGNGGVFSGEYETYYESSTGPYYSNYRRETQTGAGLGLAIGGKFMTKSGWIGEIVGGVGRNFINNDEIDGAYPRFGITIGKRF